VARRYARKTVRLADALSELAFLAGGETAAKIARAFGLMVSPDALLGHLRRKVQPDKATPRVLGVDDFAFRRGSRYGTILVDLERRCPVDLLPDREAQTLARWLKEHPGIQIVSRDRSFEYAKGIRTGAPEAIQVADRFHLLKNMREMLERIVERNRHHLKGITLPTPAHLEAGSADTQRPRLPARRSPAEQAARVARWDKRRARLKQIHSLHQRGESVLGIARQLGVARGTVYRYVRLPDDESATTRTHRVSSMLDPFVSYLSERWAAGCQNGLQLLRELRERGYPGSRKMVAVWVQHQRTSPAPTSPRKFRAGKGTQQDRRGCRDKSPPPPTSSSSSSRQFSWFLLRELASLSPAEQIALAQIRQAAPELAAAQPLVQRFWRIVCERTDVAFVPWREAALTSGLPDLCNFVAGLDKDKEAVSAALHLSWSNGPVEGQVNRLKMIKRQMYGRASFGLLRARVLYRAA
jgi:transposase